MSISSDNFTPVDGIRTQKVLDAREAIQRGAMDTPEIFDGAMDLMIDHAWNQYQLESARVELMDAEFERQIETHSTGMNYFDDYE